MKHFKGTLVSIIVLSLMTVACGGSSADPASQPTTTTTAPATTEVLATTEAPTTTESRAPTSETPIPVEPGGGIGDSPFGSVPFFAANDDQCTSPTLTNDDSDDQLLRDAIDCLFAEFEAGVPVVLDLNIPTVEGDPIYYRYHYDGELVTIVEDNRLDSFGTPKVNAQLCTGMERGSYLPEGTGCTSIDHPGFPEAG